ncbi:uncharacterized protein BHQ10_009086 [Talaromyces amestolkiae]|uniref:Protein kinase domain-containing protein n=1 Tax=Talaromyces amestolkiae TaxID=1196081 RepID=A0A364LB82_TALAM|nr:uncharacterized protein BHQ10_009086 [Talaromyces amestolkiae]RAO73074.1 hypothetical protein BHQ10_009086 [Talaromyces amestolkiae]
MDNESSSQNLQHEEYPEAPAASRSLSGNLEYLKLYPELTAESSSEGEITSFRKDSEESLSPSKIIKASGESSFTSRRTLNWSEISSRLKKRKALGDSTSIFINGTALHKRTISKSIEAPGKARSMSGSFEYSSSGENPNIQISAQGDITVTVGYEQLGGDKASSSVLVIKEWRGINKNGIGTREHGFRNIFQGHTSTVFEVDAVVTRENAGTDGVGGSFMTKLAVKQLKKEISSKRFDEEYQSLYAVSRVHHPNIVTFLGGFLYGDDNTVSRNFLFPMAIGDMKQFICGSINHSALSQFSGTLWAQFEGLASAIQFLHDRYHMLADFGIAKKNTVDSEKIRKLLRYEDVWKLGIAFAELLTYLGGSTVGVKQFYKCILFKYDEDTPYNENIVKLDIMAWLRWTLRDQPWGKEVTEITLRMLGTRDECPSAAEVSRFLANSSSACFFDGRRFVHFENTDSIPKPSILDKTRSFIEQRFGALAPHHSTKNGPQSSDLSSGAITTPSASPSPQAQVKELYWCVDKAWVEPSETWLCIEDPHQIAEDRILCTKLKASYDRIRGLRGRYLSWKTCLGIKFTSFNRLYTGKSQVICMSVGLPKPPGYEYVLSQPELVHMAIASEQILAGIHDPSKVVGNDTLEMIPKKVDPLLQPHKGAEGWGLHAVQGWSMWKIVLWMGALTVVGLLFVVLWLVLVDSKDLQNAFTPGMFLVAMLCLALGVPQFLDAA